MRLHILAAIGMLATAPVLAQTGASAPAPRQPGPPQITTPGLPEHNVVQGVPGETKGGPGRADVQARGATGADNYSTDTAATSNASNPSRAIPNTGGGAGGSGGGN